MDKEGNIVYRINPEHKIVFVNEYWYQFASENNAPELTAASVLDQSLWSFLRHGDSRDIYTEILKKFHPNKNVVFRFRCDSPDYKRLLEMNISADDNGEIQFETRILQIEKLRKENFVDSEFGRTSEMLRVCSWCKRFDVGQENWEEIEKAVNSLGFFENNGLPQLTHGMCQSCYEQVRRQFETRKPV